MANKTFLTVGPSALYPTVPQHLQTALAADVMSLSHRSKAFVDIYQGAVSALRELLSIPANYYVFFVSSSLESMERCLQNTVERSSFHLVNGEFSRKFFEFAKQLGKQPQQLEVAPGHGFSFDEIVVPAEAELICITENETSTGVALPLELISAVHAKYPDKLIAVDIVSSAPYPALDFATIDMAFWSGQKGFGIPAGMGVLVVSPRAIAKTEKLKATGVTIGSFHNFIDLATFAAKGQTPETPNVLAIDLMGKVTKDMLELGIGTIRIQTRAKAKLIYEYLKRHSNCQPFVTDAALQSQTTIVVNVGSNSASLIKRLEVAGFVVSSGYGPFKDQHLRIANFPAVSVEEMERLVGVL